MKMTQLKSYIKFGLSFFSSKTYLFGVSIKLTEKCPANCVYCKKKFNNEQVNYFYIIKFLKKYIKKGLHAVILSGGDPYEYSKIQQLIAFLKQNKIYIIFNTSGYYINNKKFRFLLKQADEIQLSLDGPEKINCKTRGKNDFRKTLKTIEIAVKNKIKTTISCVLTKYNINKECFDFFLLIKNKYNIFVDFEKLSPDLCDKKVYEKIKPENIKLKKFLKAVNKNNFNEIPDYVNKYIIMPEKILCRSYKKFVYIDNKGDIYPCVDKIGNKCFLLGNIKKGIIRKVKQQCDICYCNTLVFYNLLSIKNFPLSVIIKKWLF